MGDIGAPELLIIGVVIVLLFGATRLPATAKGLGQALRLFKKEIRDDDVPATSATTATAPPAIGAAPAPASALASASAGNVTPAAAATVLAPASTDVPSGQPASAVTATR